MAIPRTIGIETEFGIAHRGVEDPNPISASSILIGAYVAATHQYVAGGTSPVSWDFIDESPGMDARGYAPTGAMAPEIETHLVNAVLTNGARYYVDHAHPELSTPECADALSVVRFDRAAEIIAQRSMEATSQILPPGEEIVLYKNNSDGKGNSYGCHENYLVDRSTPFGEIVTHCTAHFVTRQIYTGAGKVGSEVAGLPSSEVPFQITQRADFFEEEVGLETTLKRPIINTRDEPHSDARKYRRLHVIVGDANMSEVATFLKVGTTAILLALVEDNAMPRRIVFASPVAAIRQVSTDLSLSRPIDMADGTTATALDIQWEIFEACKSYVDQRGTDDVGGPVANLVLQRWEKVLTALATDHMSLSSQLDWVAKYRLLDGYRQRHGIGWDHPRMRAMDIQYHDLRPAKSLAAKVGLETLVPTDEATTGVIDPPDDTRAYFRGECLKRYRSDIVAANWDSMVFDIGSETLRRVPMMEPLRGTREHMARLFEESGSAADLLRRLGK